MIVRNRVPRCWHSTHCFGDGKHCHTEGKRSVYTAAPRAGFRHSGFAYSNSLRYGRASVSGMSVALFVSLLTSLRQPGLPRAQSRRWRRHGWRRRVDMEKAARLPSPHRHTIGSPSHIGKSFFLVRTSFGRASPGSNVSKGAERQFFCRSFRVVACLLR